MASCSGHLPSDIEPLRVKLYPYRTALVREVFLTLPRELLKPLEEVLAIKAGGVCGGDNHVVYEVNSNRALTDGALPTYIGFNDWEVLFGHKVEEGNW